MYKVMKTFVCRGCMNPVTGTGRTSVDIGVNANLELIDGSQTWPVRKENEVALQQTEMGMVRWMCGVKLQDRVPSKGLRERLGLDDIISVLQQNRLRWCEHVLRKKDSYWMKKCI